MNELLYYLGEKAKDLLHSTNITEDEGKEYSKVLENYDRPFHVRKNISSERSKFNHQCRLIGETADQFITSLYTLAENCNYRNLKEEMIQDRLVVGMQDIALSKKLQLDDHLVLEKAKVLR